MGKKKKKENLEQLYKEARSSFPEALLAFQIQVKEEAIDRLLLELKELEEKNEKYRERNKQLKEEELGYIKDLLNDLKKHEKLLEEKEVVTRDDVEEAMREQCQYIRDQEQLLKDLNSQISEYEEKLSVREIEKDYWLEYKNVGSGDHAKQIQILEKDIQALKDDLNEMTEFYRSTLQMTKEKIDRMVEKQKSQKKEWATENAVQHIDKSSCREIKEHEWLKEEVEVYKKEVSDLEASAQLLEEENIYMIQILSDCRLQHLRISRPLFLTQGAGLQGEDELLSANLEGLACGEHSGETDDRNECPKSMELPGAWSTEKAAMSDTQSEMEDSYEYLCGIPMPPTLDSLLYEDEKDFQEYLKLGPLEIKLMSAVGKAMPIHLKETPSKSHLEGCFGITQPGSHITYRMIKSVFS
ncbi:PREDICTED: coiled-coil domain-containing protein 83 [Crocodylus porosus]|uniref:Coiled-coil domain containing 83 n=1 Tax=Crocodylus porosus TaxID=8502 RepID=A0A7M4FD67_CROPO|nr:PREDICTED: coiled-coil domain-containing protein 83 [Crocodylus porosus]XP_019385938.1 PREDICTED: coiled-coil domain-containing protein 83 [Crocodylus porosus]XP_019385939.1 PREDICTED: coiled-coil domain-containing protein 83 [Crocodylus porosus]